MAIKIDDELYRSLFDSTLGLVREMTPKLTKNALANEEDPSEAVADALDKLFKRVLQGYEKLSPYTREPKLRPSDMRPRTRTPFA